MSKKKKVERPRYVKYLNRFLFLIIICLVSLIVLKANPSLQEKVYKTVFQNNFSFTKINDIYEKYFGSSLPFVNEEETEVVSSVKLEYDKSKKNGDGVSLTLADNYAIPAISRGLVIFAGEKEGYGNTIVIQRPDNVEVWYSNLDTTNISLYDYVKAGDTVGEAKENTLNMYFQKEGKFLNYKDYI